MRWEIHTLDGRFLRRLQEHEEGEVRRRFNGERTASVNVSIYDEAVTEVRPLKRLLKAWHDKPDPIFTGPILMPEWAGEDGRLTITAQDASFRLNSAPLLLNPVARAGSYWQEAGLPAGGYAYGPPTFESLDQLIEAARPAAYGFDDPLIPDHGVRRYAGTDLRKPMPVMEITRGESVYSLMGRLSQSVFGPDWDLRPIPQTPGSWDYCELDIWRRRGRELHDDPRLAFHYRHGRNNVVDASYRPAGDQVVNGYFSAYSLAGDSNQERIVHYFDPPSIREHGFIAKYESNSCNGSAGKGIAQVAAYRQPPRFFTFSPAIEGYTYAGREDERFGVPPQVGKDYDLGDSVRVIAKRGYFEENLVGRVIEIALREVDKAGNVQADVTVVPRVGAEGIEARTEET